MNVGANVIQFPRQRDETEEILAMIKKYKNNTAGHIEDVLSAVRGEVGDAIFLHFAPAITEILWEFAKECHCIGTASLDCLRRKKDNTERSYQHVEG